MLLDWPLYISVLTCTGKTASVGTLVPPVHSMKIETNISWRTEHVFLRFFFLFFFSLLFVALFSLIVARVVCQTIL